MDWIGHQSRWQRKDGWYGIMGSIAEFRKKAYYYCFHNNKELSRACFGTNQTLQNTQESGQTIMRFQKLLNDGPVNTYVYGEW